MIPVLAGTDDIVGIHGGKAIGAVVGGTAGWFVGKRYKVSKPLMAGTGALLGAALVEAPKVIVADGTGLGVEYQTPRAADPFALPADFRCPPGQTPIVLPSGEVTGCRSAPLVAAGAPGMAMGLPGWVPWVVGGVALLIFIGTVWK